MLKITGWTLICLLILQSCRKDTDFPDHIQRYLHISHTRLDSNPNLDQIIEGIDYSKYDMLWLGGDLAYLTSFDESTIQHADSLFDFSNPNTLWALGNHDYSDVERVKKYTNRPTYYARYFGGMTCLVLDTQDSVSNITGDQLEFLNHVLDTISNSRYLVLLTHQLIWLSGNPDLELIANQISNGPLGTCSYCINPNQFYIDIYPRLVEINNSGIPVICIGGDIGSKSKSFEHITPEGIQFIGSGIKANQSGNLGLIFEQNFTKNTLSWSFEPIEFI